MTDPRHPTPIPGAGAPDASPWPDGTDPIWSASAKAQPFPRLEGNLDADVAIIGGGITGLTAAALLKDAGRRVVLLDALQVARGESGRTTAHLTAYPDTPLRTLLQRFGRDRIAQVWESQEHAIRHIEKTVRRLGIDCDFRRVPAWRFTERDSGARDLQREHTALLEIGAHAALVEAPLPFVRHAALRLEDQAQFHPGRYLLALARTIPGGGSHVFEETRALAVEDGRGATRVVRTAHGLVHARDVIVAAHVPVNNRVFLQTKIAHYRTYALAARLSAPVAEGLFWDDEDPYHYLRVHPLPDGPVLIVGGEDHRTGQDGDTNVRFERLLAWTMARFPVQAVQARWSGQIIEPVDGLPYIGLNSFSSHVWEATGFSGNGLTYGTVAGLILSDAILGRQSSWAQLYDATRITPLASARNYIEENVAFPLHFIGDRLKSLPSDLKTLPREDGRIFEVDGHKVAVFRDVAGELHAVSPVCTHLRCLVEFNRAEKTWDCPCHGSRFDVHGEVLNGPATNPLLRIHLAAPEPTSH